MRKKEETKEKTKEETEEKVYKKSHYNYIRRDNVSENGKLLHPRYNTNYNTIWNRYYLFAVILFFINVFFLKYSYNKMMVVGDTSFININLVVFALCGILIFLRDKILLMLVAIIDLMLLYEIYLFFLRDNFVVFYLLCHGIIVNSYVFLRYFPKFKTIELKDVINSLKQIDEKIKIKIFTENVYNEIKQKDE